MAELLKDMFFTEKSVNTLAETIHKLYPEFDKKKFINLVFDQTFKNKELKEKMHHTANCLFKTLPDSYKQAIDILIKAAPAIKGFEAMSLPDYVELYGLDDPETSLQALLQFTKYSSSEFAIRPFLDKNPEKVMEFMSRCGEDTNENVRRFASEGCRPRLPWAMALPKFKQDPEPVLSVLEKLKNDESEFVRRSVANNLNDISKDNPEIVLDVCERWYGYSENINSIVKHACRSLLKAGNKRALKIFGFGDPDLILLNNLKLTKNNTFIGDEIYFSFDLQVNEKKVSKIRLEYAVYYVKAHGKLSKKIFQIIEKSYQPGTYLIKRKQTFVDMTTRKHYPGQHKIAIIVNGEEKIKTSFEIVG